MDTMIRTYWVRFFSPGTDPRPTKVPSPVEWWCTGTSSRDESVLCAIVKVASSCPREEAFDRVKTALEEFWPGMRVDSMDEKQNGWRPSGGRFPSKPSTNSSFKELVL